MILPDLRMHRACPDRTKWFAGFRFCGRLQIFLWIGDEFAAAVGTAEIVVLPGLAGMVRSCSGIDCQAADRIVYLAGRGTPAVAVLVVRTGGLFVLVVQLKFLEPDGRVCCKMRPEIVSLSSGQVKG